MPLAKKITKVVKRARRAARPPRLVLAAHRIGGSGLRALADNLSEKVGYRVLRVLPHRILGRPSFQFHPGLDKIQQLTKFQSAGTSAPDFTTDVRTINDLDCKRVVARRLINASEGRGITVFDKGTTPPPAPLYVAYITKKKEFRVHVLNNEIINVAEKRKKRGFEQERDSFVRNVANGYVFCRGDVVEPADLRPLALAAVQALGRSYGAVDVIWNAKQDKCFVLEVNSRPGMEGTTVEKYAQAILRGVKL